MKIAVAKYAIQVPADFSAFAARQAQVLGDAAAQGARIAVLPEYLALELAATFDAATQADLHASLAAIQRYRYDWLALYARLAKELDLHIVAGSFLLAQGDGRYRNRSDVFTPQGTHAWQDKLQLTGFEKGLGVIDGGDAVKVFDLAGVRSGVSVCYDSEFPLPVRAQAEAGARLLLVPSCTDTDAGATRVRVGCLAWSPALDINTGEAAIFAPMDRGLPADGVVVQTVGDQPWAIADLDLDALERSRADAQVANDSDWAGQLQPALVRARVERLD
ncbi:MAG: nitrilase [Stenotrophomonas acidaminiphila]|nr:MAG: nitrilase [Stenotrophomonas acidaminiphila]